MASKKQAPDALIGKRVQIRADLDDELAGGLHVWAGQTGVVTSRKESGIYQVRVHGAEREFTMTEFSVVAPDNSDVGVLPRVVEAYLLAPPGPATLVDALPALAVHSLTNPRRRKGLDIDSLNGLAASIKVHGLAQPILVRPLPAARVADTSGMEPRPVYEVIAGERRWRACQIAGLARMPMLVRDLPDDAVLEMQLVENIEREDLDPMEEAEGFELLRGKLGYTVEQIAERIGRGKGASYVYKTLKLCALTPESREAMYQGTLSRSTGLLVARYQSDKQAEVVKFIENRQDNDGEPMPFRTLQPLLARHFHLVLEEAPWSLDDAQLVATAGACSACPKRSGNQGDIFGDAAGGDDSCTDATCFDSKRQAHVEAVKAQAEKDGFKVLDEEETRRAKPYQGSYIMGYTAVDDVAYSQTGDDGTEREVTFADALRAMGKKAPKARILIDPHTSQPIMVITRELALELTPQDDAEQAATRRRNRVEEVDTRPPEEQAMDYHDVRRAVLLRMFDAVRSTPRTMAEMQAAALHLYLAAEDYTAELDVYLGWGTELDEVAYEGSQELIKAKIDAMVPEQLDQFIAMVTIVLGFEGYEVEDIDRVALASRYGIDVLAVRDKVADDLARREAASSTQATTDDAATEPEAAIGSRVRIKDGLKGPNGKARKICGRQGELGPHMNGVWMVKFEGKESARCKRDEFIVLAPATLTGEELEEAAARIDPVAAWPFPTKANPSKAVAA